MFRLPVDGSSGFKSHPLDCRIRVDRDSITASLRGEEVIYLLQARPITSLDAWSDFDLLHEMDSPKTCDREVLSTANVGEVMPGATSPLSISTIVNSSNLATVKNVTGRSTTNLNIISISHNQVLLNTLLPLLMEEVDKPYTDWTPPLEGHQYADVLKQA
uniref:Uncharacterized protein n=1 Tax=Timema poppense TaxID=170557 RepID=A0A7R9HCC7_TIMPO|nr:unnamed protein product [Timema poppensis]